jgi:hypothetical protein
MLNQSSSLKILNTTHLNNTVLKIFRYLLWLSFWLIGQYNIWNWTKNIWIKYWLIESFKNWDIKKPIANHFGLNRRLVLITVSSNLESVVRLFALDPPVLILHTILKPFLEIFKPNYQKYAEERWNACSWETAWLVFIWLAYLGFFNLPILKITVLK